MSSNAARGILLDESVRYSLTEVCQVCGSETEWIVQLVEEGIVTPAGSNRNDWRFSGSSLHTAMRARRLQRRSRLRAATRPW